MLVLVASRTGSEIYMATKENYEFCYGGHGVVESNGHPYHFLGGIGGVKTRHYA